MKEEPDSPKNIFLRDARLPGGQVVDLEIMDGRVVKHHQPGKLDAAQQSESLNKMLVLPAMAEPHAHLDKALTASRVKNPAGDLMGAISAWSLERENISEEDYINRARQAVELALINGVTAIRTHIDIDANIGNRTISALNKIKERFGHLMDIQAAALISPPITGSPGRQNRKALLKAMKAGADLVGGVPAIDPNPKECIEICMKMAEEMGTGVDLHIDETLDPNILTIRELAEQAGQSSVRITASHCVSLGMQDLLLQKKIAEEIKEAGIGVVTLPQTNLFLQARGMATAPPRGLTAVQTLEEKGVLLAAGGDNLQDPFNLMGRGDPLETAGLMVAAGHLNPEAAYKKVSQAAREVMGLAEAGPEVGQIADLVCIEAEDIRSAIAFSPASRRTYRAGKLTAVSSYEGKLTSA